MSSPDAPPPPGPAATTVRADRTIRLTAPMATRCRRRVHLDFDPGADRQLLAPPDPSLQLRFADLSEHRDRTLAGLGAAGVDPVDGWTPASAERPMALWAPRLSSATRSGRPDLLLWDGDGYRPVLLRGHRTLDPGHSAMVAPMGDPLAAAASTDRRARRHPADVLQLAHHYRLLSELGLAASGPAIGGVIGKGAPAAEPQADDGAVVLWHQLDPAILADYDARFADRLAVAGAAANGGPALAQPSRIAECRRCPWWPRCSAELEAAQDISLLTAGADVSVLHEAGIHTMTDLARMPAAAVAGLALTGMPTTEARARARAWLAGLPMLRRMTQVGLPRADVELDVDMESYLDDGAYLWGTYLTGRDVGAPPGYRPFVTWEPLPDRAEGVAFVQFWTFLTSLRTAAADRGLTFAAYCYSRSAEERWLRSTPRRYPELPGMPTIAEVAQFCASGSWIDIYAEIRARFVVPGSMRLKALAPLTGFGWRDPEPGGENSMAWYRAAVGADTGEPDARLRDRVLRYNEDDVLATLALRRWVAEHADEIPTVAEIDAD